MTSKEMAKIALSGLEDKKGDDIKIIDISEVSVMADYFLIASGTNRNQVQAMADTVEEKLHEAGVLPRQIEGYNTANWVLMDFNDVIVHIFNEEDRLFYNLEKIWLDGKVIDTALLNA
ncbi:MAG: ribosome silencing factor [Lachnospiraceae bacterium]|nr:ribosome silencing factor [Lachnospiraceae bacterium]